MEAGNDKHAIRFTALHRRRTCRSLCTSTELQFQTPEASIVCLRQLKDDARMLRKHFAGTSQNETAQKSQSVPSPSAELTPQVIHPAQAEWEALWYHGVSAAYQKISHHFPECASVSIVDQSVSEPTLNVSSLSKDDQALFEQDATPEKEPFAPASDVERTARVQSARQARNDRQRTAILLGLPTFDQYNAGKQTEDDARTEPALTAGPSKRQLKREAKWRRQAQSAIPGGTRVHVHRMSHSKSSPQPAQHRPLVVGLTKPENTRTASTMASNSDAAPAPTSKPKKAPKQQKAAPITAPTSPALIDLRVGHILRAIKHPNADSLYVSTIAMGDEEGTDHTQKDEETGKIVRTVCSGLAGLVPLEEMQDRKIIVVANLKPVNMRSIKSAAMVLAASPKQPEGADSHAPDRVVELVQPPEGSEAGDKVYFEGWSYGEGKGPEKQLNPKKKQWEAIQPGFYTGDNLVVGFDAGQCEEVEGSEKGNLVVEGKGVCTVKTLKGAVVR